MTRSYFLYGIYTLVAVYAAWILLMPWVPAIADASMRRFHLSSSSFGVWAIQQPIPAMYNFANTYEIRQWPRIVSEDLGVTPLIAVSPLDGLPAVGATDFGILHHDYINHFPSRCYTFSAQRIYCCGSHQDRWIVTVSNYRGRSIETLTELKSVGSGEFEVTRTDVSPH